MKAKKARKRLVVLLFLLAVLLLILFNLPKIQSLSPWAGGGICRQQKYTCSKRCKEEYDRSRKERLKECHKICGTPSPGSDDNWACEQQYCDVTDLRKEKKICERDCDSDFKDCNKSQASPAGSAGGSH